ncbi:hypothetical protein AGMMS49938_14720 [Fibrobacterales bacterium]|nr:hypothetical protein AGMMS49938_14640 [Fibrobacterales bacterium]GHV15725.1 hypothetical protein AGMMS49938_14720 [Fibrobacterales bacterium]
MNSEKLSALLAIIIPPVIQHIVESKGVDAKTASEIVYNSELYAMLENEESKLWHLSPETLCILLDKELKQEPINYPEEL